MFKPNITWVSSLHIVYSWEMYHKEAGMRISKMQGIIDSINRFFGQVEIVEVGGRVYVKKKYTKELGVIKWFIIKSLSIPVNMYPFVFSPRERMKRELSFFDYMYGKIKVPRVVEVNWDELYIVREYVNGRMLSLKFNEHIWGLTGSLLYKIHSEDYALGDSKISNFLVSEDENTVYVIDAEQAIKTSLSIHKKWDIVVLLATLIHIYVADMMTTFVIREEEFRSKIERFLKFYVDSGGVDVLDGIRKDVKSKTLVHLLIPFPYNVKILKIINQILVK